MQSSKQNFDNKVFQTGNAPFVSDVSIIHNQFFLAQSHVSEDQQFLLDNISDYCSEQTGMQFMKSQVRSDNFLKEAGLNNPSFAYSPVFPLLTNPQEQKKAFFSSQIAAKMDEDLLKVMKFVTKEPNKQKSLMQKGLEQKSQKSRRTLSRLSQQFNSKNAGIFMESSGLKEKFKSRQTIGGFAKDVTTEKSGQKKQFIDQKMNEILMNQASIMKSSKANEASRPQKMQVQQPTNNAISQKVLFNEQQNKLSSENENVASSANSSTQINQQYILTQPSPSPIQRADVQARYEEVKQQRNRITVGRDLISYLIEMNENDKKNSKKVERKKQRESQNISSLKDMISLEEDENSKGSKAKQQENGQIKPLQNQVNMGSNMILPNLLTVANKPSRQRLTQFIMPIQPQKVILEDQKQDDFTPMKGYFTTDTTFLEYERRAKQLEQLLREKNAKKPIDYRKFVLEEYFNNVKERIQKKRKSIEQLTRQKQLLIAQNKKITKQFTLPPAEILRINHEKQILGEQIWYLEQKANPEDYLEYRKFIHIFEVNFGIKLHRYDRIQKIQNSIGFYAEFTVGNILCKVKRNSLQDQFQTKFYQRFDTSKIKNYLLTTFGYEWRIQIYSSFISKKMFKTIHLLSFMTNFIAYIEQLNKFQITFENLINLYDVRNVSINDLSMQFEFEMEFHSGFEFLWKINLIGLRENGGVLITDLGNKTQVSLGNDALVWKKDGNKMLACMECLAEYCEKLLAKRIDQDVQKICNNDK